MVDPAPNHFHWKPQAGLLHRLHTTSTTGRKQGTNSAADVSTNTNQYLLHKPEHDLTQQTSHRLGAGGSNSLKGAGFSPLLCDTFGVLSGPLHWLVLHLFCQNPTPPLEQVHSHKFRNSLPCNSIPLSHIRSWRFNSPQGCCIFTSALWYFQAAWWTFTSIWYPIYFDPTPPLRSRFTLTKFQNSLGRNSIQQVCPPDYRLPHTGPSSTLNWFQRFKHAHLPQALIEWLLSLLPWMTAVFIAMNDHPHLHPVKAILAAVLPNPFETQHAKDCCTHHSMWRNIQQIPHHSSLLEHSMLRIAAPTTECEEIYTRYHTTVAF